VNNSSIKIRDFPILPADVRKTGPRERPLIWAWARGKTTLSRAATAESRIPCHLSRKATSRYCAAIVSRNREWERKLSSDRGSLLNSDGPRLGGVEVVVVFIGSGGGEGQGNGIAGAKVAEV